MGDAEGAPEGDIDGYALGSLLILGDKDGDIEGS